MHRTTSIIGVVAVVSAFTWPAASTLFLGGTATPEGELAARVIAFVVLALVYAFAVSALLLLVSLLPSRWHFPIRLALVLVVALGAAFLVPFAALLPVVGIRSLCFNTPLCESPTLQYVPHALYVAGSHPLSQVAWALAGFVVVFSVIAFRSAGPIVLGRRANEL